MPVTIVVPQLGESVVEGTVGKWLKKEGDPIAKDEPIVEIITDKINIELPAPSAGTLGKITVPEGTVAVVGQQLGVILGPGESLPAGTGAPAPAQAQQPQRPQAPPQGGGPSRQPEPARAGAAVAEAPSGEDQRVSPAVRKLLKEHNLDVSGIRGSGMGGRVTREDVLNHIEGSRVAASAGTQAPAAVPGMQPGRAPSGAAAAPQPTKPIPAPSFTAPGAREEEVVQATNVRKKIAENMLRSRHMAAHCSTWDEVDMTRLVELRSRMKERVKSTYGMNLTYMPFIMKAVV
ncbi:MAG TPA: biotin/lipoyl-containing protein, partial [Candidatus Dormibacteraeota bacterium]|nr:biotin/lipoyl-containing protein [Candidatus Dormibacteraeota bacterium]